MNSKSLISLRHKLHSNPEVSNREYNTSNYIRKFLGPTHPDRILMLGHTGLAFVYESKESGPTVVFRAELDALPIEEQSSLPYRSTVEGVSHVCGHDGHMTILAGLGMLIAANRPEKGKVVLLYQNAEEVEQGARDVVNNNDFKKLEPDYVFALHNIPGEEMHSIIIREGTMTAASRGMTVTLTGKSSHAAEPEKGINPALAISEIIRETDTLLQDKRKFRELILLTVIHIKLGEKAFGTSPGEAEICFTLRAFKNEDMEILVNEIEDIIRDVSDKENLKHEISYNEEFPATENDTQCIETVKNAAKNLDLKFRTADTPYPWSEDFAYFTNEYRGCLFGLGSGKTQPALHNPHYDFPDTLIETGVKMFERIYKYYCF